MVLGVSSIGKLCEWFAVPRRTMYYRLTKAIPKVDARFAEPIKAMIEEKSHLGYRTVAHLLDFKRTRCSGSSSSRAGR